MNEREAMKQALEALETLDCGDTYKTHNAASALRKALAQPEQELVIDCPRCGHCCPQRTWVGLTDEEISSLWDGHTVPVFGEIGINPIVFARAIEAAHGIKE